MIRILSEIKSKKIETEREKERLANRYTKQRSTDENGNRINEYQLKL